MGFNSPRNPLAYPGGNAAINTLHPMAPGARMALVPAPGGGMIDLTNGRRALPSDSSIVTVRTGFGPANNNTNGNNFINTIVNSYSETPTAATVAGILAPIVTSGTHFYFTASTSSNENVAFFVSGGSPGIQINNSSISIPGIATITVNVPYFIAFSVSTAWLNWVVKNLQTGQVWSGVKDLHLSPLTFGVQNTNWAVGFNPAGAGNQPDANIATLAYSINNLLTLGQLQAWAQKPWEYWYPPNLSLFSGVKGSGGVTAAVAYTEAPDAVSIMSAVSGAVAYTEAPDGVAIAGAAADIATLAYTEPADSVGVEAGTPPPPPPGPTPYWHGPPAMWPYRIDFTGPVIYVRAAVQVTGPACVGFRIGDIYFRRRALNYLDNIPDNPPSIAIPCFASQPTAYATLAYTEPPDIISIGSVHGSLAYTEPADTITIGHSGGIELVQFDDVVEGILNTGVTGYPVGAFSTFLHSSWHCMPITGPGNACTLGVNNDFFQFSVGAGQGAGGGPPTANGTIVLMGFTTTFPVQIFNATFDLPPGVLWHLMISIDSSTQRLQIYVNDVPVALTSGGWLATGSLWTNVGRVQSIMDIGGNGAQSAMGYYWDSPTPSFVDLTVVANRRKFINADLTPANLGADGSNPFGTQPPIYLTAISSPYDFLINYGSGGRYLISGFETLSFQPPGTCPFA